MLPIVDHMAIFYLNIIYFISGLRLATIVAGGGIAQSVASLSATQSVLVRARYDPFQKGGTLSLCY